MTWSSLIASKGDTGIVGLIGAISQTVVAGVSCCLDALGNTKPESWLSCSLCYTGCALTERAGLEVSLFGHQIRHGILLIIDFSIASKVEVGVVAMMCHQ